MDADPTSRFVELVQRPDDEIPLDEATLLIAAHDHPVAVAAGLAALDAIAASITVRDAPGLARALGRDLGFSGDVVDYHDPRNSFLDEVLARRTGMPITLAVVVLEVGRRLGIPCWGVGLPGHFLVGCDDGFVDLFSGGTVLDAEQARMLLARTHPSVPFAPAFLDPVGTRAILARILANLVHSYTGRAPLSAVWALRLRLAVPDLPAAERAGAQAQLDRLRASLN